MKRREVSPVRLLPSAGVAAMVAAASFACTTRPSPTATPASTATSTTVSTASSTFTVTASATTTATRTPTPPPLPSTAFYFHAVPAGAPTNTETLDAIAPTGSMTAVKSTSGGCGVFLYQWVSGPLNVASIPAGNWTLGYHGYEGMSGSLIAIDSTFYRFDPGSGATTLLFTDGGPATGNVSCGVIAAPPNNQPSHPWTPGHRLLARLQGCSVAGNSVNFCYDSTSRASYFSTP